MNSVEILTKPNCHLCEVAKEEILELKEEYEFTLTEINITQRTNMYEMYKDEIPVIFVNGIMISRYELDKKKFMKFLKKYSDD